MIPRFKTYLEIARAEFLVFSFVVASVPVSLSIATGGFDLTNTVLATVLLVASHVAVNSINVASDYRRGIDEDTEETPFSGGVDTLTSGRADYTTARNIGVAFSVISFAVMVFFVQSYGVFPIGIVFLIGLVLVLGYTDVFTRVGLGETSCGLGLGALPTVGIFYVQSGNMTQEAVLVSVPMFLVCFNLLLFNEFPDIEADAANGRMNVPIAFGRKVAGYLYISVAVGTIVSIIGLYISGFPPTVFFAAFPALFLYRPVRELITDPNTGVTESSLLHHTLWTIFTPASISVGIGLGLFL
jgi:1,4-dihydroxy-2-naphthoate octaprenyltransferase